MKPQRASVFHRQHMQNILRFLTLASILLTSFFLPLGCHRGTGSGRGQGNAFVIALSDDIRTIDPIGSMVRMLSLSAMTNALPCP